MRAAMVGRGAELAALRESLEEAARGRRRLVLVSGEPGIGKSRLLDEFAGIAGERGDVAWGRCWEAGGAPAYWPWTEVLRETLRSHPGSATGAQAIRTDRLAQLLPELTGGGVGGEHAGRAEDPDTARFLLFEAVAEFLRNAARERPLVLLFDDLHAADESSLLLLQFLAAETAPAQLLLVAAYRDVELRAGLPLTSVARDLARLPAATRMTLTGLSQDEVARLTEITTSIAPSDAVASRLRDQTAGNPLYVAEVVRLLAAEGRLDPGAGFERLVMPRDVRETVLRRLVHLSDDATEVVSTASVFGRDVRIDALSAVSGSRSVLAALAEAEAANLISPVPDRPGHVRFSHAVVVEALYDELPLATRLELHGRAGEALERLFADDLDDHLAELARHYCAAVPFGDTAKAVDYSLRAGDRAVRLLAYEEGVRLYELAVRTIDATASWPADLRARALLAFGDAQARAGDSASAQRTFLRAAELARRTGDGRALARAALGYGGRFVWLRAASDTTIVPLLREALAAVPADEPALRARLLARLAGALRDEPSMRERADLSVQAVELARTLGDPAVEAYALASRFTAIWGPDAAAEELPVIAAELVERAGASQDIERLCDAYLLQFEASLTLGRIEQARLCASRCGELADKLRQPSQRWYGTVMRSVLTLLDGDLVGAEQLIEDARRAGQGAQRQDSDVSRLLALPIVRWEQGRLGELEDDLARARVDHPGYPVFGCVLALLHAETGRTARAGELVDAIAADLPKDNSWLSGMTFLAETVVRMGDADRAGPLYDALVPYAGLVGNAGGEPATGAVDRSLGQLATLCGRYDDAERHFAAAHRIHAAIAAAPWAAHTEHDHACMLQRRAGPGDLAHAEQLAASCRERCGALGLVALGEAVAALGVAPAPAPAPPGLAALQRDGEYWRLAFDGRECRLRHTKGLEYLARLLADPGTDIAAVDLVVRPGASARPRLEAGAPEGDTGMVLDARARGEYRHRLTDLQADLDEAERWGDGERFARTKAEMDFLLAELAGAVGLAGRPRRTGSPAERARQSVRKAVSAALDRIAAADPDLGRHLAATVRTGYLCRYEPDPRVTPRWHT